MANIKLTLPGAPFTGQIVSFTAPCDCTNITDGLVINGKTYTVVDALCQCVTGKGGAWIKGAQLSVLLDVENAKAYLQNAAPPRDVVFSATVTPAWTASGGYYYQDIPIDGITEEDAPCVDILPGTDNDANEVYAEAFCDVIHITTADGSIRVWAKRASVTVYPIQLKVVR